MLFQGNMRGAYIGGLHGMCCLLARPEHLLPLRQHSAVRIILLRHTGLSPNAFQSWILTDISAPNLSQRAPFLKCYSEERE